MDIQIEKSLIELKDGSFIFEFNDSLSKDKCDEIIGRFENSSDQHYKGRVGQNFKEDSSIKKSTDMVISGKDEWKDIDELLFTGLAKALSKIKKQYSFFNGPFKDIGYAIQRTDPGGFYH